MTAMPDSRRENLPALAGPLPRFVLLYAALYAAYGTEAAYTPAFMQSHGLAVERIGFVLAAGTVVRIVAGPMLGRLADRLQARKRILVAAAALSGIIGSTYAIAYGFLPLLAVSMAHAAATAGLAPLTDALALAAADGPGGFPYGWVRGVGSGAFVIGTLISGQCVDRFGLVFIILASSALFGVMALCATLAPSTDKPVERGDHGGAVRTLWNVPGYPRLLIVAALVIGSHAMNDGFSVIRWRASGLGSGIISLLWSESVLAEVAVFFLIGPWLLGRLGPARCAGLSALAGVLRWTVLGSTTALPALFAVQLLHGFTFALLHLAAMALIVRQVPARLAGTAQTVYGTFALGIASAVLTVASGYLYGWFGMRGFWAMALLCVAALPLTPGLAGAIRPSQDHGQPVADPAPPSLGEHG